ncbi:spore germination protein [Metabacillus litoralis]|uniref:spore germination protein n=1 Tax=Metabacillus litoralis TaxID=152268 RepID=UPI0022B573F3|nr:spore germination protein [Metabacillus litoralis]
MNSQKDQVVSTIKNELNGSSDLVVQQLDAKEKKCEFYYISSICNKKKIHDDILTPFFEVEDMRSYKDYLLSLSGMREFKQDDNPVDLLIRGSMIISIEEMLLTMEIKEFVNKNIPETTIETTIQGPQTGFSEDLETNLNILRHRYHQPTLVIEDDKVGKKHN